MVDVEVPAPTARTAPTPGPAPTTPAPPTPAAPTRVALCGLDELTLSGLAAVIDHESDMVVTGTTSSATMDRTSAAGRVDVVVVGSAAMPDVGGPAVTACAELARHAPVVAILDRWATDTGLAVLRSGVRGMALRSDRTDVLVRTVRDVGDGLHSLSPAVAGHVVRDAITRIPGVDPAAVTSLAALTRRETEVLTLLVRGRSLAMVAVDLSISGSTVKSHLSRLLGKLGLEDRTQAVALAHAAGLHDPSGPG